jgi:predicted nucleic acid-binding protein
VDDRILLDTSVLIDYRRGYGAAREFTAPIVAAGRAAIHPVVSFELFDGLTRQAEIGETVLIITTLRRLPVRDGDFTVALELFNQYRLRSGIEWPDCMLAATALRLAIPIATLNSRHFSVIPRLKVIRPY